MVDSRALKSEYVWPETVADRKCTYTFPPKVDAYMYTEYSTKTQWLVSRPAKAVFYKRFQVGKCSCFFYVPLTCQVWALFGCWFLLWGFCF